MGGILNPLLRRYDDRAFVIRLKARFIAYCYLTELLVILAAIFYAGYAQIHNPLQGYALNMRTLSALAAGFVLSLLGLYILVRGHYTLAANLLLIFGFATVWATIMVDRTHVVSRLDSIVLVMGLLSMTPIVVLKRSWLMGFYAGLNILCLFGFMFLFRDELNLPYASFISYLADNTVTILAIAVISHQVFSIHRRALDQAESDIQVRKRAEKELRESEHRLQAFFNSRYQLNGLLDPEGRLLMINETALAFVGGEASSLIGRPFWDLPHWSHDEALQVQARKAVQQAAAGRPVRFETTHQTGGGEIRNIDFSITPVFDDRGEVVLLVPEGQDITERTQSEKERQSLSEQLLHAQKMEAIGTLAGGIAHDFNNILSSIFGFTELAKLKMDQGQVIDRELGEILVAASRAKELVSQILTFSRQADTAKQAILIQPLVKETIRFLRASLPALIEIQQDLSAEEGKVVSDPTQVYQLFMNLFTNAAHAMKDTGGAIHVALHDLESRGDETPPHEGLAPGSYLLATVSDTGHGMSSAVMQRIFDPFFTTKERGEGTGLGLSVVHGIVEDLGGVIDVESEPGKGTTFRVFLPKTRQPVTPVQETPALPVAGAGRVLLVDDESAIIAWGQSILEMLGYEVVATTSPQEALALFESGSRDFDAVLTDMTMPKMTGLELSSRLKRIRADIPILLITGFASGITAEKLESAGVDGLILKPFVASELSREMLRVMHPEGNG